MDFEELKEQIPKDYHFLLEGRLIDTSTIQDKYRTKELHGADFNRCEKCGYDLLNPDSYRPYKDTTIRHPYKGYISYYNHHKLVLCDKCVDELNGQSWD